MTSNICSLRRMNYQIELLKRLYLVLEIPHHLLDLAIHVKDLQYWKLDSSNPQLPYWIEPS